MISGFMVPQIQNLRLLEIALYTVQIQVIIWSVCSQLIPETFCWNQQLFVNMKLS